MIIIQYNIIFKIQFNYLVFNDGGPQIRLLDIPHLRDGTLHALLNLLLALGATATQPRFQVLHRRRLDEHIPCIQIRLLGLQNTLNVNVEDAHAARAADVGDGSDRGAVDVAVNLSVLNKLDIWNN